MAEPEPENNGGVVHFDLAASALGVSRKTVERLTKAGELERVPHSGTGVPIALVTKESLVALGRARGLSADDMVRLSQMEVPPPRIRRKSLNEVLEETISDLAESREEVGRLKRRIEELEAGQRDYPKEARR